MIVASSLCYSCIYYDWEISLQSELGHMWRFRCLHLCRYKAGDTVVEYLGYERVIGDIP